MVRRPVLGIEEADLESTVNWLEPHSLGKNTQLTGASTPRERVHILASIRQMRRAKT